MNTTSFFKTVYEPPTESDIRRVFPEYRSTTLQEWQTMLENSSTDVYDHIRFTLQKLSGVTTSVALTPLQKQQLEALLIHATWNDYCSVVNEAQISYVGI